MYWYAQIGCLACLLTIQESDHPVTPSVGITSLTFMPALVRSLVISGQPAPIVASPSLNSCSKSVASTQYLETSGFWAFSLAVTFASVAASIEYGSCWSKNCRAGSAIWIGLFGTVILPLFAGE